MPKSMWANLEPEERDDLVARKKATPKEDWSDKLIEMAQELQMYAPTLERRINEWAKLRETSEFMASEQPEQMDTLSDETIKTEYPDANHMEVTFTPSRSQEINSLDDLIAFLKVDMEVWDVDHWVGNTWPTTAYDRASQEFQQITNAQVKAWFVRRKPVAVEPVITPVRFNISFPSAKAQDIIRQPVQRALIIPDMHVGFTKDLYTARLTPFHDRKAIGVALALMQVMEFDAIVYQGDNLDLADHSMKFPRTPEYEQVTQPALEELAWLYALTAKLQPYAKKYYIEGNHEKRQRLLMAEHVPQMYHVKRVGMDLDAWSLPYLLGLDDLGITWVGDYPNGEVWLNPNTKVVHGDGLNAEKIVNQSDVNVLFGHVHKYDAASRLIFGRGGARPVFAMSPGFLGRLDGAVPGRKNNMRWNHGLAVVDYDETEYASVAHVLINKGFGILDGSLIEGQDYTEQLRDTFGSKYNF